MKVLSLLLLSVLILVMPLEVFAIPVYNWDFMLPGYASHNYDYADIVDLKGAQLGFLDTYSWSHALPMDFNPLNSNVTSAQLWISARGVMSDYSTVAHIEGICRWEFLEGQNWHWSWRWGVVYDDRTSESVIGLPTTADNYAFWQNDPLDVTVGTDQLFTRVNLDRSVLMMDYNSSNTTPTIPEPTTIALFGLGLVGLITVGRKI
jgi:hypothetical protein